MLTQVQLLGDVHLALLSHALTTAHEEIAGLLIGLVQAGEHGDTAMVTDVFGGVRSDRRADRVEMSHEQLTSAANKAEQLAQTRGMPLRVIGWYHSHPKLTVWPSHVDLNTQYQFQALESTFVGIIVSCFDKQSDKISITAFQSIRVAATNSHERHDIPIRILSSPLADFSSIHALPMLLRNLWEEEKIAFEEAIKDETNPLNICHNNAVYAQALTRLVQTIALPLLGTMRDYDVRLKKPKGSQPLSSHPTAWQAINDEDDTFNSSPNLLAPTQSQAPASTSLRY